MRAPRSYTRTARRFISALVRLLKELDIRKVGVDPKTGKVLRDTLLPGQSNVFDWITKVLPESWTHRMLNAGPAKLHPDGAPFHLRARAPPQGARHPEGRRRSEDRQGAARHAPARPIERLRLDHEGAARVVDASHAECGPREATPGRRAVSSPRSCASSRSSTSGRSASIRRPARCCATRSCPANRTSSTGSRRCCPSRGRIAC